MCCFGLQEHLVTEKKETKPAVMNAFELISLSHGLNLSGLFETPQVDFFMQSTESSNCILMLLSRRTTCVTETESVVCKFVYPVQHCFRNFGCFHGKLLFKTATDMHISQFYSV